MFSRTMRTAGLLALALSCAAQVSGQAGPQARDCLGLAEVLVQENLTVLASLVDTAGLRGRLDNGGQYTIFAPNDQAFAELPAVPSTPDDIIPIIQNHVISGAVVVDEMDDGESFQSLKNETVMVVSAEGSSVESNCGGPATVVKGNIDACGGSVVHVIDALLPTTELCQDETQQSSQAPARVALGIMFAALSAAMLMASSSL